MIKGKKAQIQGTFSNLVILVIFLVIISVVGLLGGVLYYQMNILETSLKSVDFVIPVQDNSSAVANNVTNFQDIMEIVVYPFLGLRTSLPYLSYFMVFGFIIALGMTAYLSSKNPLFFILHLLFTFLITYFCVILSNTYTTLLSNPFINQMMLDFTIYNKLMLYLPQVVFFTSLVFATISFINLIKPQTSNFATGLQYGGDY